MKKRIGIIIIYAIVFIMTMSCINAIPLEKEMQQQDKEISANKKVIQVNSSNITRLHGCSYIIDDKQGRLEESVLCYKDRIYIPLRKCAVLLGAEVRYESNDKLIIISKNEKIIKISIKEKVNIATFQSTSSINGSFDTGVLLYQNKLYVPIRCLGEQLGYSISYVKDLKTLICTSHKDSVLSNDSRIEVLYQGEEDFNYTKAINPEDIESGTVLVDVNGVENKVDVNYVKNQLVFYTNEEITFNQVRELMKKYDAVIVGYVSAIDFYQVEFKECTLEQLLELSEQINKEELIYEETAYLNLKVRS